MAAAAQPRASHEACVARASTDSALYPQRIDSTTTIIGVSCRQSGGRVVYVYGNKFDVPKSQIPAGAMTKHVATMRAMLCTDPKLTSLLKLIDMEYAFYDVNGVHVSTMTNRIEDCAGTSSAAIASQTPAVAAELNRWSTITARNGGSYEFDRDSVVRKGRTAKVWTRAVYREPIKVDFGVSIGTPAHYVLALRDIDCLERRQTVLKFIYAGADGQPIPDAEKGPYTPDDIVPGTPGDQLFRLVCKAQR